MHYVFMYINNDYYCLFPFGGGYAYGRLVAAACRSPHNRWFSLGRGRGKLRFKYSIHSKRTGGTSHFSSIIIILLHLYGRRHYTAYISRSLTPSPRSHSVPLSLTHWLHAPDTLLRVRSYVLLSLLILHIITMIIDSNRIMQARQKYN